jgi:hypothetical protein
MSTLTLRRGLVAVVLVLSQVPASASIVLDNSSQWLSSVGLSSLSQIGPDQTIDFAFNAAGTPTGWNAATNAFNGGQVPQFDLGLFGFNNTPETYSQLFVGADVGHITSSVSLIANPWQLQIIGNGGDPALAFNLPSPVGTSAALGMQFWSKTPSCALCFAEGVRAFSFDLVNYQQAQGDASQGAEEGLLMVTYKDTSTGALRSDYAEIFKTSGMEVPFNVGVFANAGEVVYETVYFTCLRTADHVNWDGCGTQAALDNLRVIQSIPEPATPLLFVTALFAFVLTRWRLPKKLSAVSPCRVSC